jgi:dTDP-4-dehydrorhamnose reductase
VYGETKLAAERLLLERNTGIVVRTSFNYGFRIAPYQACFFEDIIQSIKSGKSVPLFYDQYRSPMEVDYLSKALLELAQLKVYGVLHVAGSQRCNRVEYATELCQQLNLSTDMLLPRSQDEIAFKAKRPKDISMNVSKAQSLLKTNLPDLQQGISFLATQIR